MAKTAFGESVFFAFGLLISGFCAASQATQLPPEVSINPEAGRGGLLVVNLRMNGEVLPFILDTGASGAVFDESIVPRLGRPVGTTTIKHWGVITKQNVYALPKLFLGGAPLLGGKTAVAIGHDDLLGPSQGRAAGILGYECLRRYCVQLDFAAGKLRFLDDERADKSTWGKSFPIVPLNENDERPAVAENLLGQHGPHSLIDSGFDGDGWLMTNTFAQWTNHSAAAPTGQSRSPHGLFAGEKYALVSLQRLNVESDGIGLRFLARHLVTLDFPKSTLYLRRQSLSPLSPVGEPDSRMKSLQPLISDLMLEDADAAQKDLATIEKGPATEFEKTVARKLVATVTFDTKVSPAEAPPQIPQIFLGDAKPQSAEVGWLDPAANRIPLSAEVPSPLLDCGKVYATGLFAHSPSRYVFNLDGKWERLRGEAGLHTAFQPYAFGVVFIIKGDGHELFRSPIIRGSAQARYDLDLSGVKTLELITEKAQERNGGNWALWLDPILSRERMAR